MPDKVEIISKAEVFKKFIFRIEEVHLRHQLYSGQMSGEVVRLNFNRGDSVGMLMHHEADDTVLLIEQFRYPAYSKGAGWIIEVPAGVIDEGEDAKDAAVREIQEEVGYTVQHIEKISTFFVSPGGTSERIHLFYAKVTTKDKTHDGGGRKLEGEDIRSIILPVDEAFQKIAGGEILDAKTIIALQWLQMKLRS